MATFDLETFIKVSGRQDAVTSLGTAFGMPTCLLNFNRELLNLLPSPILDAMADQGAEGRDKADEVTKDFIKKLALDTGIIEFDTETGTFRFVSDSSRYGMDRDQEREGNNSGGFLGALNFATGFAGRMYQNYEAGKSQIDSLIDCFQGYNEYLKFQSGNSANERDSLSDEDAQRLFEERYGVEARNLKEINKFIARINELLDLIASILRERALNPSLEPIFSEEFKDILSGTDFIVSSATDTKEEEDPIFRLVFGPPQSKQGNFLLTVDGLYYDSQTSGIQPALLSIKQKKDQLPENQKWKFKYDPNLGGRGDEVSNKQIELYVNTVFDPDILDDSEFLQEFYKEDHFLQTLIGEKDRRIHDLSSLIRSAELVGESQAVQFNIRQTLISEATRFNSKVKRRKKQIEIAVKAPAIYGGKAKFTPGNIPINDFSYLQELNIAVSLERQKALVLDQESVSGVILPLNPKFVVLAGSPNLEFADHLVVEEVGAGSIVHGATNVFSTQAPAMSLTDVVTTDKLFAIYNFLEASNRDPSSTDFQVNNCATDDIYNNAQLVTRSLGETFIAGLGVPYLKGITKHSSVNPNIVSSIGSYVRLPDTSEFADWTYSKEGFSFDFWLHMPNLDVLQEGWQSNTLNQKYRIILSNENVGMEKGGQVIGDENKVNPDYGSTYVRGMMLGFTRDSRITDDENENNIRFFLAPTQSMSPSGASFINNTGELVRCASSDAWYGLRVDLSSTTENGNKLFFCCKEYVHVVISVDVNKNKVDLFVDSELLTTSSIGAVFGIPGYQPPRLPSFKKNNSFEYSTSNTNVPVSLQHGPKLNKYFTPWILGGGYTDGYQSNNFMGNTSFGPRSGLEGSIGSVKFYSKPLTSGEVLKNYLGQKDFFKNIEVQNACWEDILTCPDPV